MTTIFLSDEDNHIINRGNADEIKLLLNQARAEAYASESQLVHARGYANFLRGAMVCAQQDLKDGRVLRAAQRILSALAIPVEQAQAAGAEAEHA